ncbi:MAG: hypothetical protein KKE43_06660 [Actinobacteria bacterium]|nr:hypothetical protein [Actinomycetota bacterium]
MERSGEGVRKPVIMGLFDEQVEEVGRFLACMRDRGDLRELEARGERWPSGSSLLLAEDTAMELGNPSVASLSFVVWGDPARVRDGVVSLVGPDIAEVRSDSVPFAQVLIVSGEFTDEYESYRDLREAIYDTLLDGFTVRTMPSRQSVWCRVSREAMDKGFSLGDLGAAMTRNLKAVEPVSGAEALFVTSSTADVEKLAPAASGARRIVEALMKMYEEENFDCETCEYKDVCDEVMDLKKIREKLADEKARAGP